MPSTIFGIIRKPRKSYFAGVMHTESAPARHTAAMPLDIDGHPGFRSRMPSPATRHEPGRDRAHPDVVPNPPLPTDSVSSFTSLRKTQATTAMLVNAIDGPKSDRNSRIHWVRKWLRRKRDREVAT